MVKAIIFDCFGVLLTDALSGIVAELRKTEAEKADHIVATVDRASKGLIPSATARTAVADMLGLSLEEYSERIRSGEVKNQQLLDYIATLRPKYKTALLSNIIGQGLEVRFTPEERSKYFDVVIASGDIGYAKPEAQAYEITADRLGVRLGECIMIDDREEYCQGAIGVGMQAIRYWSFEQIKEELQDAGIITQ